jgi:hypothetical protein
MSEKDRSRRRQQLGDWFSHKYRRRVWDAEGVQPVALQLRKQGVPLNVALKLLGIKPTRRFDKPTP